MPVVARAQALPPSNYQTERDSLWQRAARVRTFTDARIAQTHSSFIAFGGTSRRTLSLAQGRSLVSGAKDVAYGLVKREVVKHKTHGADVAKVFYYTPGGSLLLAELYQQNQLVRLRLYEYNERNGPVRGSPFRTAEWVRGDYLHLTTRHAADKGGTPATSTSPRIASPSGPTTK